MQTTDTAQTSQKPSQPIAKLPEVITQLLKESGVAIPYAWAAGIHEDAMHEEPRIQMFQCARQWSAILSVSKEDTRFARYCLASAPTIKIWLNAFATLVVPLYLKLIAEFAQQNTAAETAEHAQ